jgi:hypothetical protein
VAELYLQTIAQSLGVVKQTAKGDAMNERAESKEHPRLIPVPDWSKHHDWPPLAGLRHLIFNKNANGFHKCVRRVGRRVLIDEKAFFDWVSEQDENAK